MESPALENFAMHALKVESELAYERLTMMWSTVMW